MKLDAGIMGYILGMSFGMKKEKMKNNDQMYLQTQTMLIRTTLEPLKHVIDITSIIQLCNFQY